MTRIFPAVCDDVCKTVSVALEMLSGLALRAITTISQSAMSDSTSKSLYMSHKPNVEVDKKAEAILHNHPELTGSRNRP